MMLSPLRLHFFFLVGLFAFMAALTIGPRVGDHEQNKYCVVNVHLVGPFGLSLNCDTQQFLRHATDFSTIYEPDSIRQSRPGLIYIASLLAKVFQPLSGFMYAGLKPAAKHPDIPQERLDLGLKTFIPAYAAYILINVAVMVGAFHLLWRTVRDIVGTEAASSLGVLGVGLFLIFNDVAKGFLLSPHSQLFNIFVPVMCLWVFHQAWRRDLFDRPGMFPLAVGTAIGFASYAPFALVAPCLLAPAALRAWQRRTEEGALLRFVYRAAIFGAIMITPNTLWYFHVKAVTHGFYVVEVEKYRLFIWMLDVYHTKGAIAVVAQLFANLGVLTGQALIHALPALAVAVFAVGSARATGVSVRDVAIGLGPLTIGAVTVGILFIVFYAAAGRVTPRLALSAAPPIMVLASAVAARIAACLPRAAAQNISLGVFLPALGYGIWTVVKFGPYYTWGE